MQELIKYINELLYLHDCVVLPGFGGFVSDYKSAEIDPITNSFVPPSKYISFNANLNANDGLLINKLVEEKNYSYLEAEKIIHFFVEDVNVKIQRGERVYFVGLGYFYADSKFLLNYEPNTNTNYLIDSFGLRSFICLPKIDDDAIVYSDSISSNNRSLSKRLLYAAAIGVPILFFSAYFGSNRRDVLNESNHLVEASLSPVIDSPIVSVSSNVSSIVRDNLISPSSDFVSYSPVLDSVMGNASKSGKSLYKYYLIAGSFSDKTNAYVLKRELEKKSYPAFILKNNRLFSVVFKTFSSLSEAQGFKTLVVRNNPKANTWIMKKRF